MFLVLKGKFPWGLLWLEHHRELEASWLQAPPSWWEAQCAELITQSFKLNYAWHVVLRQNRGNWRKSERDERVIFEVIDESSGSMLGWWQRVWNVIHSRKKEKKVLCVGRRRLWEEWALKGWEVPQSGSGGAIIMQWPWLFNGVISAMCSCQCEISTCLGWSCGLTWISWNPSVAVLIDVCTCGNSTSYCNSKNFCCSHKWIDEIWFQGNLNYCTLGGWRIWWGTQQENTDAPLPRNSCIYSFRCVRIKPIYRGLFMTMGERHAISHYWGVNITAWCEGESRLEAVHPQNRIVWQEEKCSVHFSCLYFRSHNYCQIHLPINQWVTVAYLFLTM